MIIEQTAAVYCSVHGSMERDVEFDGVARRLARSARHHPGPTSRNDLTAVANDLGTAFPLG